MPSDNPTPTDARPQAWLIVKWRAEANRLYTLLDEWSHCCAAIMRQCADELAALDQPAAPQEQNVLRALSAQWRERAALVDHARPGSLDEWDASVGIRLCADELEAVLVARHAGAPPVVPLRSNP